MRGRLSTWTNLSVVTSVVFLICNKMKLSDTTVHQMITEVTLAFHGIKKAASSDSPVMIYAFPFDQ